MSGKSQHKVATRQCPQCGLVKTFPVRNETCSQKCATDRRRGDTASSIPTSEETHDIRDNTWVITLPKTRIHTLEELLEHCKVDLSVWEVDRFLVNKWEIGRKNKQVNMAWQGGMATGYVVDEGNIFVEPLFQVKAWLRRKVAQMTVRNEIASMKREAQQQAPIYKVVPRKKKQTGNMLEISIPDLQLGRFALKEETGHDDYNINIAESVFDGALSTLLDRVSTYQFDQICFVVGNDLLNVDNIENTTTAGTSVTTEGRYFQIFGTTRKMIVRAIERLRTIAPVYIFMVQGNHDTLSIWHLGDSLEIQFSKCSDVTINNAPAARKYHQYGNVMLMWTHGDKGKHANYPLLMATEQPAMFGSTIYREVHVGHKHHVHLEETNGVRVRILPSLSAPDDWSSDNGFVGNIRSAEAYIWNKNEGLVGMAIYSVSSSRSKTAN